MLTLLTSGTTKAPKKVTHSWDKIEELARLSIKEIGLTSNDRVLDVFPGNTIAHYTVTAFPAYLAKAHLISAKFEAIDYIEKFKEFQPTYIALIPRHWELLSEHNEWHNLDMSCVRYMVTGSGPVPQEMIDDFKNKGVQTVANWYGMTEFPPPVFIGYNSSTFDITNVNTDIHHVMFNPVHASSHLAECIINGISTGDIFNMQKMTFHARREEASGNTWKTI